MIGVVLGALLLGCGEPVDWSEVHLVRREGRVAYEGEWFSGVAEASYATGRPKQLVSFSEGRRHGKRVQWYANGTVMSVQSYRQGKLHGWSRTWWPNGRLRSEGHYRSGVAEGRSRQWYQSGALFKELRYRRGQEQGLQRAWRENGILYSNYEARNGRIYGLKRSKLCFQLDDEEVIRDDGLVDVVRDGLRDPVGP